MFPLPCPWRRYSPVSLLLHSLLCLFFTGIDAAAVIPQPNGTYGTSLSIMKLTDQTRIDPYSPDHQHRSVMISAFCPVAPVSGCRTTLVDYMPPATAAIEDEFYSQYGLPNGSFENLKLSLRMPACAAIPNPTQDRPLILFSPGLGNSRLIYSALAQSIASQGFTVLTIDHPYDANVVEYPDGTLILGANITTSAQIELALTTRVQDVSFILDQLSHDSAVCQHLNPSSARTEKFLIAGHSLGGATAAAAMVSDHRFIGGANLDGTFFGPVLSKGLDRPFLLFGHQGKNQSTDTSWKAIWPELKGWKIELMLKGSQHATFSDLPLLVDVLGLRDVLGPGVGEVLGTIDGGTAREIESTYLSAFFHFVRDGVLSKLLQGNVEEYPEVEVVAQEDRVE